MLFKRCEEIRINKTNHFNSPRNDIKIPDVYLLQTDLCFLMLYIEPSQIAHTAICPNVTDSPIPNLQMHPLRAEQTGWHFWQYHYDGLLFFLCSFSSFKKWGSCKIYRLVDIQGAGRVLRESMEKLWICYLHNLYYVPLSPGYFWVQHTLIING